MTIDDLVSQIDGFVLTPEFKIWENIDLAPRIEKQMVKIRNGHDFKPCGLGIGKTAGGLFIDYVCVDCASEAKLTLMPPNEINYDYAVLLQFDNDYSCGERVAKEIIE